MDEGSTQARFLERVGKHEGILHRVAGMYASDHADREDLEQEILLHLWKAYPRYDERRVFSTWMYRIALNVAISRLRRTTRRQQRSVALDETANELVDPNPIVREIDERVAALHRFIAGLGALDRGLMMLYLDEMSHADIAEVLGISTSNVGTRIHRLKQRLRNELEPVHSD